MKKLAFGILLCLTFSLLACGNKEEEVHEQQTIWYEEETLPTIEIETTTDTYVQLNVDPILQYPELPTGCEITCLTMLLNYHGYDVDKVDLVNNYMLYRTSEYPVGFGGNPFSSNGSLMWPPAMVDIANNFLLNNNDERKAQDKTGLTLDLLFDYLKEGIPVAVWVNETFSTYVDYDGNEAHYNGYIYRSYWGEHCIILKGYDLEKNIVYINNPQRGEEIINLTLFEEVYNACGKYAVLIDMLRY